MDSPHPSPQVNSGRFLPPQMRGPLCQMFEPWCDVKVVRKDRSISSMKQARVFLGDGGRIYTCVTPPGFRCAVYKKTPGGPVDLVTDVS